MSHDRYAMKKNGILTINIKDDFHDWQISVHPVGSYSASFHTVNNVKSSKMTEL